MKLEDLLQKAIDRITRKHSMGGIDGVLTGFRGLDNLLGGFQPGTMNVLAGRTGMGKTSMAIHMALSASAAGFPVQFLSVEMSAVSIAMRFMGYMMDIDLTSSSGVRALEDKGLKALHGCAEELMKFPLTIENSPNLTAADASRSILDFGASHDTGLIIIDHFHRMDHDERDVVQLSKSSNKISSAIASTNASLLLLAQLNRGLEHRETRVPVISDLRHCGSLEEDADNVLLIHRNDYFLKQAKPDAVKTDGGALIIPGKVRDGDPAPIPVSFLAGKYYDRLPAPKALEQQ